MLVLFIFTLVFTIIDIFDFTLRKYINKDL